jgi:RNA polymerase sigma factor (sigma-70 family)
VSPAPPTTAALLRVLDADPELANAKYVQLFHRLRLFFSGRHRSIADELAQETLRRGFTRIQAGAEIFVDPVHYFMAIARNVAIEKWRAAPPPAAPIDDDLPDPRMVDFAAVEARICVDQCLKRLPPSERDLLLRYYDEDADHEALAQSLGVSYGNLRQMAFRTKNKLAREMKKAIENTKQNPAARHTRR